MLLQKSQDEIKYGALYAKLSYYLKLQNKNLLNLEKSKFYFKFNFKNIFINNW